MDFVNAVLHCLPKDKIDMIVEENKSIPSIDNNIIEDIESKMKQVNNLLEDIEELLSILKEDV